MSLRGVCYGVFVSDSSNGFEHLPVPGEAVHEARGEMAIGANHQPSGFLRPCFLVKASSGCPKHWRVAKYARFRFWQFSDLYDANVIAFGFLLVEIFRHSGW